MLSTSPGNSQLIARLDQTSTTRSTSLVTEGSTVTASSARAIGSEYEYFLRPM